MRFIFDHGSIDKKAYIALHKVSESRAKQDIRRLVDKKLIEQDGKGPASRYVIRRGQKTGR